MRVNHLSVFVVLMSLMSLSSATEPQFTAMFIFGDSLIDPGNNIDFGNSLAKANYWPYGVDSDRGPTGRFSNGKILVDFIGELFGFPDPIPAYEETTDKAANIVSGVNYASAGAGILQETGSHFGRVIPLRQQIDNFKGTLNQLREQMQGEVTSNYLAKALVILNIGANDYLNNYMLPVYQSSRIYNPQQFADHLINLYTQYILEIQGLGLRKFFIADVAPLGCIPAKVSTSRVGECDTPSNNLVQTFNSGLKSLISNLNSNNPGSIFTLGASFQLFTQLRDNADSYGFKVKDVACCGLRMARGTKLLCLPNETPCFNRDEYLFWDAAHPTETVNRIIANEVYNNSAYTYPVTLEQMATM